MTPVAAEGFLPEIAHCTALLDEQSMSRDVNHTTNALALIGPSRICWALAGGSKPTSSGVVVGKCLRFMLKSVLGP